MIDMTLTEVASVTGGTLTSGGETLVTGDVVADSRAAGPGTLFAAFEGAHVDGHDFVGAALDAGAAAAFVTRTVPGTGPTVLVDDVAAALGRLARHVLAVVRARRTDADPVRVVAVTGSYGKTTTKDLLARLLAPLGETIAPPGSFNNEIGLPLTVLRTTDTTSTLVLEMGADRVGNLAYLTSIAPPDVAVVLAVGRAHLGEFGGIENVARAKAELVAGLVPGGTAVLNADDPRVAAMAEGAAAAAEAQVLTFGRSADADLRAEDVRLDGAGHAGFRLLAPTGAADVRLALVGEHHVTNALAAAAVALHLGVGLDAIAEALATAGAASPHRMDVRDRGDGIRIVDDSYNANPDSVRAALRTLAGLSAGRRRVAVLGEMLELGEDSAAEHASVGAETAGIDLLVAVGPGTAPLGRAAREAGVEVLDATDAATARELLDAQLRPGDVVLLKGSNGAGIWRVADHLLRPAGEGDAPS
ncbi:UDP-N-acetylmuramoyl-tripeptide--D-alanyl-D-alanine ligase [Georgenia halophila]|uniref:UDP-N-acetylmuramoyl-tripeptide--D-alanyl-D-alanine ligase n=1 Tax=Georgenia halophila TaxID=620889 RepID=A0ABP8L6J5_9MICO